MKQKILLVLLIFLIPISCFAEENIAIEKIKEIENAMVDEEVIIKNTEVKENTIILKMQENETEKEIEIPYEIVDSSLIWKGGYVPITINEEQGEKKIIPGSLINNQYAFYLYNILNEKAATLYDEENYYNETLILEKINELIKEDNQEEESKLTLTDSINAFSLQITKNKKEDTEEYQYDIEYIYHMDSKSLSQQKVEMKEITQLEANPNTSNYSMMITVTLLLVIGIAIYTVMDPKKY